MDVLEARAPKATQRAVLAAESADFAAESMALPKVAGHCLPGAQKGRPVCFPALVYARQARQSA
jgi:hypothetical protein